MSVDVVDADRVRLIDALVDSEFIVKKIEEDDFLWAMDNYNWVYSLHEENFNNFEKFIRTNYQKLIESNGPKLLE
jgi:hypothetical protein